MNLQGRWMWLEMTSKEIPCVFPGPTKYFPVATVNRILKDVLTAYLQEAKYDPEFCKQMTKTISEVQYSLPSVSYSHSIC